MTPFDRAKIAAKTAINKFRVLKHGLSKSNTQLEPGSVDWLISTENHFGGYATGVPRRAVSAYDSRTKTELSRGGMTGGDRMLHHGYAEIYFRYLSPFLARRYEVLNIVEVGILRGTGLALWSSLFPNSHIIGLDIDLSHTRENIDFLKSKGAFAARPPELHVFDQLADSASKVDEILSGRKIDICIDDGLHTDESIVNTLHAIAPHLNDEFVFFIEDHNSSGKLVPEKYSSWKVTQHGEICVITPNKA